MAVATTILGLSVLIILHELGHYLVARACGMRVLRFSVGFGPALFKRRLGETDFQFAAVPLGGYVLIDGMGPAEEDAPPPDERTFRAKPVWQRILVIFAGPFMNWVLAAVFIAGLATTIGFTRFDPESTRLGRVLEDSPAAAAGLLEGDQVSSVAGSPVHTWAEMVEIIQKHPETAVVFVLSRDGAPLELTVTPKRDGEVGRIGVEPWGNTVVLGLGAGVAAGFTAAWNMSAQQVSMLWGMVIGREEGQLTGLPGIIKMVSAQAKRGIRRLLETLAWLSVTLAILNLAPIPALDGGRLVFLTLETVRGRPVDHRLEGIVHGVGFLLLMALMIFVSVRDLIPS